MEMNMLFDSDEFVVVSIPFGAADGYEIVNKEKDRSVFLFGDWATAFTRQIKEWQENTPHQEEVEDVLEGYTILAQNPLVYH